MRRVVWSVEGRNDYREAARFIARDNPNAARLVQRRIKEAVALLAEQPIGHPGPAHGTYEKRVLKTPYIIAYALSDETLTILRVIHMSRRWEAERWPED